MLPEETHRGLENRQNSHPNWCIIEADRDSFFPPFLLQVKVPKINRFSRNTTVTAYHKRAAPLCLMWLILMRLWPCTIHITDVDSGAFCHSFLCCNSFYCHDTKSRLKQKKYLFSQNIQGTMKASDGFLGLLSGLNRCTEIGTNTHGIHRIILHGGSDWEWNTMIYRSKLNITSTVYLWLFIWHHNRFTII